MSVNNLARPLLYRRYRAGRSGERRNRRAERTKDSRGLRVKRKEPRPMLGGFKTKSVIAKWYLTKFCGLKVGYRVMVPHCMILGFVVYTTAWVIVPA